MKFIATRVFPRPPAVCAAVCAAASLALAGAGIASAQTYYVNAVSGSDANSGLTPGQAWQSLTNVDNTSFAPGASILFADGDNFYGTLNANSSGTTSAPITYGSYYSGTGSTANPTFWGSDPVAASSFTPFANVGGDETYAYSTPTTVNSFLVNDQFAHSALILTGQSPSAATNVSYVESNPNTWYYNTSNSTLYVDPGATISSNNLYTVAVRQNIIANGGHSNLVFTNLNTAETAAVGGLGYGYFIQGGSNVTVENASVTGAGVHGVGALDTTNFLGQNLSVSNMMPDQGYGGASAYVAYSDYTVAAPTTSTWINDSFTQPNGNYAVFITHSTPSASVPSPIGSVTVQNMSSSGSSLAMAIYANPNEQVTIQGGTMAGLLTLSGNNMLVNGVTLVGPSASINLGGNNNVVQNSIINGASPNWNGGVNGAIVDDGNNNIVRFNTIVLDPTTPGGGAAIGLDNPTSGSQFYANIIVAPFSAIFENVKGTQTAQFFNNLYFLEPGAGTPNTVLSVINSSDPNSVLLPDWTDASNTNAIYADPMFFDPATGNFYLLAGSLAIDAFDPTTDEYVPLDIYGDPRAFGLTDLGAVVPEPGTLALLCAAACLPALRRFRPSRGKP